MNDRERFWNMMAFIAKRCEVDLDDTMMEIYDNVAKKIGFEHAVRAVSELMIEKNFCQPRDFPSPKDLMEKVNPVVDEESMAVAVTAEIWRGIAEYGRTGAKWAEQRLSRLAWAVVKEYGSWSMLCLDSNEKGMVAFKAQLRGLAESVIVRAKAGTLDQPLALPSPARPAGTREGGELTHFNITKLLEKKP